MKKTFAFLTALLLLISLASCGAAPAQEEEKPDGGESPPAGDSSPAAAADDTLTPVTTEEEVRALYAADPDPFSPESLTITSYEGDFLVQIDRDTYAPILDWVYGQSGIRRRMLCLYEPLLNCEIQGQASVEVVTGGPNTFNGVPGFPHVENVSLSLIYDEQGMPLDYDPYASGGVNSSETYWANAGESYSMGMAGRREAVRSAQIDAGGVTVAFAPLADGSDFTAAYCEIPYTEVSLPENGNVLFVTFHDTFLDRALIATSDLLTLKPIIYAANMDEDGFANQEGNEYLKKVRTLAEAEGSEVLPICAKLEQDIAQLEGEEKQMFLEELGIAESGLDRLIKCSYSLLGLISFLTYGKDECRAWTIKKGTKAPQAAGKIHSDIERGFIRAEVIAYDDMMKYGSVNAAKEKGQLRSEGKDYVVQDGDMIYFRFNV